MLSARSQATYIIVHFLSFSISLILSLPVSTICEITNIHSNSPATSSLFFWQLLHKHLCPNHIIFSPPSSWHFLRFPALIFFKLLSVFWYFSFLFFPLILEPCELQAMGTFCNQQRGSNLSREILIFHTDSIILRKHRRAGASANGLTGTFSPSSHLQTGSDSHFSSNTEFGSKQESFLTP